MAILSAFYSIEYMEHYGDYGLRSYYINYPLFIMGMAGIVTVDDLTTGLRYSGSS
jgi:formate hydrogenlyase subunit 3/multisubunit Na+/H+ antiporter MnhD subunit